MRPRSAANPWAAFALAGMVAAGCVALDEDAEKSSSGVRCSEAQPAWSEGTCPGGAPAPDPPAGYLLASQDRHLFRADLDGCGLRRLTSCPDDNAPFERLVLGTSRDGTWIAYQKYLYASAPDQLVLLRADGTSSRTVNGPEPGLLGWGAVFTGDPLTVVFNGGGLLDTQVYAAPFEAGDAWAVGPRSSQALAFSPDGTRLVYRATEREFSTAQQSVLSWYRLRERDRAEIARFDRAERILGGAAFTGDGRWIVYTWQCARDAAPPCMAPAGWSALDLGSGRRTEGVLDAGATLLAVEGGADVLLVGRNTIDRLSPESGARRLYTADPDHTIARLLTIPSTRRVVFSELRPVANRDSDPARADLWELDLDTGMRLRLDGDEGLRVVEFASARGRYLVEAVFNLPCPTSFSIPSNRLGSRFGTWLRDRNTGERRLLSINPDLMVFGFSPDERAVIVGVPLTDGAEQGRRTYRVEAHRVDRDASIPLLSYTVGLAHGFSEQWALDLVPTPHGYVTYPDHFLGLCP